MKLYKWMNALFLTVIFATTAFSMAQAPVPPTMPGTSDAYCIFDVPAENISKIPDFMVAVPDETPANLAIKDKIKQVLFAKGYSYKPLMRPEKNVLMFMFTTTSEVRKTEIYINEQMYAATAQIYRDYVATAQTMSPDVPDNSRGNVVRRSEVVAPVESLTIWGYTYTDDNNLKEVWECGAASIEGTAWDLPSLTEQAMRKFPERISR
jgi:hypothetical protein